MRKLLMFTVLAAALAAAAQSKEAERVQYAADALSEIMSAPDKGIPKEVLGRCHCLAIVPGLKKAAFIVGGQHGKGVVNCRKSDGSWGPPSMMSISGGSFGFQIGGQSTDVVMVIMNRKGADFLTSNKFNIGGDLSAAAGPVGREATAGTDVALNAEIYTYSRARGLFAGISLKGAVVKPDDDGNKSLYGRNVGAKFLLHDSSTAAPPAAKPLMAALGKYAPRK